MRNLTITLDEETATWTRVEAAPRNMSVSSFLRQLLHDRMVGEASYASSMERYLSRRGKKLGGPRPTREELHDRVGLH